jgi:predicted DNA-binding protein (MmcQ/YjbR family)
MGRDGFNTFCGGLKAAAHVVQWGGSDVWKIGGKMFAVCGLGGGITFKVTPLAYEVLSDMPGLRPAPYLASRGMKWIQQYDEPGLSDAELEAHILVSYDLVADKLTKKLRAELGI